MLYFLLGGVYYYGGKFDLNLCVTVGLCVGCGFVQNEFATLTGKPGLLNKFGMQFKLPFIEKKSAFMLANRVLTYRLKGNSYT